MSSPGRTIFLVGLASAGLQVALLREFLSVFQGNELVLGAILAAWLLAGGVGSVTGTRWPGIARRDSAGLLVALAGLAGFLAVRASRLTLAPGEAFGPAGILTVIAAAGGPVAFAGGYAFGAMAALAPQAGLYRHENAGNLAGALLVFLCVLAYAPNGVVAAAALVPLVLAPGACGRIAAVVCAAALVFLDPLTLPWKYAQRPVRVVCGREGEIAWIASGGDTTVLLNGTVYRSRLSEAEVEQAVHIPAAQRERLRRALVALDRGYGPELARYPGLAVEFVEEEPALAPAGARVTAPEDLREAGAYDLVILGTGLPATTAGNRFYTRTFFQRMAVLLADSGVLAFTLPFSPNYLSTAERELHASLRATLESVFAHVWVFPGEGRTYMASQQVLPRRTLPRVSTRMFESFVVPSADSARIAGANAPLPATVRLNTVFRPVVLHLALRQWAEQHGVSLTALGAGFGLAAVLALLLLPARGAVVSIGTSGLAAGFGATAGLLLYQAAHGALYSRVSLLLMALTAGFAAGGALGARAAAQGLSWTRPVRRQMDLALGAYVGLGLAALAAVSRPPAAAFAAFELGLGLAAGLQFALERDENEGVRYAADMLGGVFGMALSTTVLAPLLGIVPSAFAVACVKLAAGGGRLAVRVIHERA